MAQSAYQYYSSTGSTHEDLGDLVTNISPTDTPFLTRVQKTKANSRIHLWATDALAARTAHTARVEGFAFTSDTLSGRTRLTNYVEIQAEQVTVADSLEWMDQVGTKSEFSHQMRKAAKNLANHMENVLWGTATAGASGGATTAPQLKPIMAWITSEVSSATANRTLTAAIFNGVLQGIWENGGNPTLIYCGGARKLNLVDLIDSTYGTRNVLANARGRVEQYIDTYQGDFGTQQVVLSRDINANSYAIIELGRWALAWGKRPTLIPIAKDGYRRSSMLVTEFTLEARAESASGKVTQISG